MPLLSDLPGVEQVCLLVLFVCDLESREIGSEHVVDVGRDHKRVVRPLPAGSLRLMARCSQSVPLLRHALLGVLEISRIRASSRRGAVCNRTIAATMPCASLTHVFDHTQNKCSQPGTIRAIRFVGVSCVVNSSELLERLLEFCCLSS
eukprot:SAG31_NODE_2419_length_5727_cov_4.235963_3_plen_148_part_00